MVRHFCSVFPCLLYPGTGQDTAPDTRWWFYCHGQNFLSEVSEIGIFNAFLKCSPATLPPSFSQLL